MSNSFDRWIDELRDDVIKGTYGHDDGAYTICPDAWRIHFEMGLTPAQAFRCALGANTRYREKDEAKRLTTLTLAEREEVFARRADQTLH